MELKLLLFAEYASITQDNKLDIGGIFDSLTITRPPGAPADAAKNIMLHSLVLVAVAECSIAEGTVHAASLRILNEDGKEVLQSFDVGEWKFFINPYGRPMRFQSVMRLAGLPLPGPGDYVFSLSLDGKPLGETTLYVVDAAAVT